MLLRAPFLSLSLINECPPLDVRVVVTWMAVASICSVDVLRALCAVLFGL